MPLSLRLCAPVALIASALFVYSASAEKLHITSTPPGATVQINGVTHSVEIEYPGGTPRRKQRYRSRRISSRSINDGRFSS
jgi:hypothetical protein